MVRYLMCGQVSQAARLRADRDHDTCTESIQPWNVAVVTLLGVHAAALQPFVSIKTPGPRY